MNKIEHTTKMRERLVEDAKAAKLGNVLAAFKHFKSTSDLLSRLSIERSEAAALDLIEYSDTLKQLAAIALEKIEAKARSKPG